ncbi:hypothetical protein CFK37_13055 [Virgibacillus phasianinus]|uniref:DUF1294 domain-containing protein n=1 Tax=Virgibacillus phasianinus TaxID=2017483 RepID=A0A220U4M1_9BACI|nr:DUF1294 domain-containing protein [Virgibacillus phasianinus]ASK63005.1 hypothetical protein CFK37_13055 [Virgibacillus phasianinus]
MNMETATVWYFIIINIIAFILMGTDKKRAINHQWRISEKTLFVTTIIGGSVGAIAGMRFFRHKTKHPLFTIGMPAILIIQVVAAYLIFNMS